MENNNDASTEYYNFNDVEKTVSSNPKKLELKESYPIGLIEMFIEYFCPRCRNYESSPSDIFGSDYLKDIYNLRNNIKCEKCHSNCLIYEQEEFFKVLTQIIETSFFNNIYQVLGSKNSVGIASMRENEINHIDLKDLGLPENAKILDINLTSNGYLTPLKFIPNNPRFMQSINDKILTFYPVQMSDVEKFGDRKDLAISIQWILLEDNDISDINLLQAIDNYIDNKPYELIMNANRCLELLCNQICFKEFTVNNLLYAHLNREKRKLIEKIRNKDYVSFKYILENFINEICNLKNIHIDNIIIDKIKKLNDLRNDIAHQGQLNNNRELTKKEKEEILSITGTVRNSVSI